jgi:CBS domain-containing protein
VQVKSITLLPIGGIAALRSIPENPWHEIAITLAGPMVNAAIACALIPLVGLPSHWLIVAVPHDLHGLLLALTQANITLFLFNFIPAFPMDGGRLLRATLALVLPYQRATTIAAMVGQGLAIVFILVGLKISFWLIIIGAFIFMGAEGEERIVRTRSVLRDLDVEDVMSRDFARLSPTDSVARGIELIYQTGQDAFPVIHEGQLLGIVSRSALVEAFNAHGAGSLVGEIADHDVVMVSPRDKVVHAYEGIVTGETTSAIVVDDGQVVGLLSPENINRYLVVQSGLKSPRRAFSAAPPRPATSQTPGLPLASSGVPPIVTPRSREESVPPPGRA